jgi:hypothetical protein
MWSVFSGIASARRLQSILLAWLPPVLVATFAFLTITLPHVRQADAVQAISATASSLGVNRFLFCGGLAFALAALGYLMRFVLYRILEGYLWPPRLRDWRVRRSHEPQREYLAALLALEQNELHRSARLAELEQAATLGQPTGKLRVSISELNDDIATWERLRDAADEARARRGGHGRPRRRRQPRFTLAKPVEAAPGRWVNPYPAEGRVLPTRVGNALRNMETFGSATFSLDSQILWEELAASAPEPIRAATAESETHADTMLAAYWSSLGFSLITAWVTAYVMLDERRLDGWLLMFTVAGFGVCSLSYRGLVAAAMAWGDAVRSIVILGREPLRTHLGLRPATSFEDEQAMWEALTGLAYYGDAYYGSELDAWRKPEDGPCGCCPQCRA